LGGGPPGLFTAYRNGQLRAGGERFVGYRVNLLFTTVTLEAGTLRRGFGRAAPTTSQPRGQMDARTSARVSKPWHVGNLMLLGYTDILTGTNRHR
ncbi:MAG: hypothetical protein PHQ28_05910, partial [Mycobacterium sp.]|nr:hypothetical protein [Mycobacterium sp.]